MVLFDLLQQNVSAELHMISIRRVKLGVVPILYLGPVLKTLPGSIFSRCNNA